MRASKKQDEGRRTLASDDGVDNATWSRPKWKTYLIYFAFCHSAGHLIQLLAESSFLRVEGPFPTGPNKAINGFEICQRLGRQIAIQEPFETKLSI